MYLRYPKKLIENLKKKQHKKIHFKLWREEFHEIMTIYRFIFSDLFIFRLRLVFQLLLFMNGRK